MSSLIVDIQNLYARTFGRKPYVVEEPRPATEINTYNVQPGNQSAVLVNRANGAPLTATDGYGVDIWLPVELYNLPTGVGENGRLKLYYGTVRITASANMVRTPLVERKGSVKELYSIDDYKITLKGFFIDKQYRSLPVEDIRALKELHERGQAFSIYNAITDIVLADTSNPGFEQQKVVMTSFELPDKDGGRKSMQPYIITLESDNVFTLEVE